MHDLIWGFGLFLVIEGLAYALAPRFIEQALQAMAAMSLAARRLMGVCIALAGSIVLWAVKTF